jgi:hypothetical protein
LCEVGDDVVLDPLVGEARQELKLDEAEEP